MNESVRDQMKYDGVSRWHDAGITGKDVVIWDMELLSDHGQLTRERVLDAAPDAIVMNASLEMLSNADAVVYADAKMVDGSRCKVEEFIKQYGIKILTRSVGGEFCSSSGADKRFWLDLQKRYGLIFFNSYGNEGDEQKDEKDTVSILVGACGFYKDGNGWEIRRDGYSSTGEGIDFIDFRGDLSRTSGTSFSAPYLAGKAALLVEKYGPQITQKFVYQYFKSHSAPLCDDCGAADGTADTYHGEGLVIMGDTQTIVTLKMGNPVMDVDGRNIIMDEVPCYNKRGDRMLVPVKFVAEAFGCRTEWDEKTKTVKFIREG